MIDECQDIYPTQLLLTKAASCKEESPEKEKTLFGYPTQILNYVKNRTPVKLSYINWLII